MIENKKLEIRIPMKHGQNVRVEISKNERCCGNCCSFTNEDIYGYGYCEHYENPTECFDSCGDFDWLNT